MTFVNPPVKGMPPEPPRVFSASRVSNTVPHGRSTSTECGRSYGGKLPKLNFPTFDGENPKLWLNRCEDYFDLYSLDTDVWVK